MSGGETSAMMTSQILMAYKLDGIDRCFPYDKVVVGFANTGEENEQTLEFVRDCDQKLGFNSIWVEAVVHHGKRKACSHKVVSFDTASRRGEPYEAVISKYGIPNQKFPHCTRELKANPLKSLIQSLGWKKGQYHIAIGMRADEAHRRDKKAEQNGIVYPLLDWLPARKADVNAFWEKQSFRLRLASYQGNCKWCWKKSYRKLMQIMDETPQVFEFPERMERQYGAIGNEFRKGTAQYERRTFFRGNQTVKDLRRMHNEELLYMPEDTFIWPGGAKEGFPIDGDKDGKCVDSCEPLFT
jgi:3'-phosphoadenosine 5'-phosphosulfate sulfotransferase (PAPS reductase)/FAD synthetase